MKFADKNRKALFTAVGAATLLLTAFPAMAQQGSNGAAEPDAPPESYQQGLQELQFGTRFDDETLQKYASATVEVEKIQTEFNQKLKGVQDREKAVEIQREAIDRKMKAVENEGLRIETYNKIATQVKIDEQLRLKVDQMIRLQNN
ncbi:MAG: DUF4168 domain-containing protein [Desulfobulbaceae bacterium]|nr:DUF4168 domain-containing protein [Desulfobulbaceae bacterium]